MGDRAMAGNCGNGNRNSELSISPDSAAILYDPNYVTYDIKVYEILNTSATHEIKATVTGWGSGSADDLRFRFKTRLEQVLDG